MSGRTFNGSSDVLTCSGGNTIAIAGAFTGIAIARRNSTALCGLFGLDTSGGTVRLEFNVRSNASGANALSLWIPNTLSVIAGVTFVNADGWCMLGWSKPAGTAALRGHKYAYGTNTWTHANGDNASNPTASGAGGTVTIGESDTDFWGGDILACAIWDRELTDAEIETLPFSLVNWYARSPNGLWLLNQSLTTQAVADLTGGGANQSGLSGSSVASTSVPGFNYGDGPWLVIRPQGAAGPAERTVAGDLPASSGTLARTLAALRATAGSQPAPSGALARILAALRSAAGDIPTSTGALAYLRGYLRSLTGSLPASTGTLVRIYQALRSATGSLPAQSGTLTRAAGAFARALAGDLPSGAGSLAHEFGLILRTITGDMPAATGTLTRVYQALRLVVGSSPAATGTLTRTAGAFARAVAGSAPAASGTSARILAAIRSVAGNLPASSGALSSVTVFLRMVTASLPAQGGTLARGAGAFARTPAGNTPSASGILTRTGGAFARAVAGVLGVFSGALSAVGGLIIDTRARVTVSETQPQTVTLLETRRHTCTLTEELAA